MVVNFKENSFMLLIRYVIRWIHIKILVIRENFHTLLRKNGIGVKKFSKLKILKNKFKGERCFIIATGPSLTNEDILKLRNEYTFSMNAMCLKYEELNWKPSFYGIQDKGVFEKLKENIINSDVEYMFIDERYRKVLPDKPNYYFFPRDAVYNAFDAYNKNIYKAKFSKDPTVVVYDGFTITCSLLQIAIYLGFNKIYLLGCDCNYSKDGKKYFVDHGHLAMHLDTARERMIAGYKAVKEYAESNDISIFNATRGGMLDVFERVNLDDVII